MIDGDGNVVDFMRLIHIMKRKNSYRAFEREAKVGHDPSYSVFEREAKVGHDPSYSVFEREAKVGHDPS